MPVRLEDHLSKDAVERLRNLVPALLH